MTLRDEIVKWSLATAQRAFDIEFADWLVKTHRIDDDEVWFIVWALAWQASQGHVCIDLSQPLVMPALPPSVQVALPAVQHVREKLTQQSLATGPDGTGALVLLPSDKLYLRRFYRLEAKLATQIADRCAAPVSGLADVDVARALLDKLFPSTSASIDQKVACANAIVNRFCVIAGGPGTGKTTTVVKLLAALIELETLTPESICLVAPTGKAAMRLTQSISANRDKVHASSGIGASIPAQASTLHRLLQYSRERRDFRFNKSNKLPVRVVVVDEASMIDLSMMVHLLDAIADDARVIVLGDQYQLASVDEGSVLAEICGDLDAHAYSEAHQQLLQQLVPEAKFAAGANSPGFIGDRIATLRFSYRFGDDTELGALARAINRGDVPATLAAFATQQQGTLFAPLQRRWHDDVARAVNDVLTLALEQAHALADAETTEQAFRVLAQFRILCAVREGALGVENLNQLIMARLHRRASIARRVYPGLPLMILENDYDSGLFNGDTGVVVDHDGDLKVAFESETPDMPLRFVPLALLPTWEPAYAMTIHKSQGSEFDAVALVLPASPLPVLTRELLYTGVTRSREQVTLFGSDAVIRFALQNSGRRQSALAELLAARVAAGARDTEQ